MQYLKDFNPPTYEYICWEAVVREGHKLDLSVLTAETLKTYICGNPQISFSDIVIVGGDDCDVNQHLCDYLFSHGAKKIIANNLTFTHESTDFLPIGLPDTEGYPIIGDRSIIHQKAKGQKNIKNSLLWAVGSYTYPAERVPLEKMLLNLDYVTKINADYTPRGYALYVDNVFNHKFVIAPRGSGLDTHRLWESLYLRTIPIVKSKIMEHYFSDLPILFINDWKILTDKIFLNEKYA